MAYVESSSNGAVYGVKAGDYIGRSLGKVLTVSIAGIDVKEIFQDENGEWREWPTTIAYGGKAVNTLFVVRESVIATQLLCGRYHLASIDLIDSARVAWEAAHRQLLQTIDLHAAAYAERISEDYVVPVDVVISNVRRRVAKDLAQYLRIMGGLESQSGEAYCAQFPALLQSEALDLGVRFKQELSLLEKCEEASPSVSAIETAYNTLFGYIPTEIVTVYVAVVAALSTPTLQPTPELDVQKQWTLLIFCIVTPLVVWIIYASKLRGAGKPLPLRYATWPVWEMIAAEIAFCAWAYALPGNPLESLHAVPTGINGLLVLITSTVLGLLSPLFQRPLQ